MTERYYFSQNAGQFGPFSATELREFAAAGRIRLTDSVWREGTEQRVLASRVKNLFGVPPAAAVAAVSPPEPPPDTSAEAVANAEPADVLPTEVARTSKPPAPAPRPPPGAAPCSARTLTPAAGGRGAQPPVRQKRVVSIKGAVLMGQDGVSVQFLKKCATCGHEDSSRSTAAIRSGSMTVPFFCPKCRRQRPVEICGAG